MNTDCFIPMNPIPVNYVGTMTIGITASLNEPVVVIFQKPNTNGGRMIIPVTTGGDGTVNVPITATENVFFSERYHSILVSVKKTPSQEKVLFLDGGSSDKEGILLSFSPTDCNWASTAVTLTKDTTSCEC